MQQEIDTSTLLSIPSTSSGSRAKSRDNPERSRRIEYSIIIPFYNEEDSIEEILDLLTDVMRTLHAAYEIIGVNDGSTDGTREKLEKTHNLDAHVAPIHLLSRNGQMAALAEGFRNAKGRTIISMDGDLQDDPRETPAMLNTFYKRGVDVLCGWRVKRKCPPLVLFISMLGNFFQRMFLKLDIHDISCTFRIYNSLASKSLVLKEEGLHRFLPYFLKRNGFTLGEQKITAKPRKYGHSKYSFWKAFRTARMFFEIVMGKY